ncbi:AT-hook motif nuclear-localized protein 5 [Argentina anserina]|uniref:AT-hook motif nuclear-localized protein 5 n=1 Tax=Argentina anserina TaxID=57926 RepID=UPI0021762543|nr:AT-hook motif nuclear-localized protein 5 [Potentilla anserina]
MDGREAMAISGAQASYYIHRGGHGGSSPGSQIAGLHAPPGFRPNNNNNNNNNTAFQQQQQQPQSNVRSTFSAEPSRPNYPHDISTGVSPGAPSGETVKKKRGRPRKYGPGTGLGSGSGQGPDTPVSLALSPMSSTPNPTTPGSTSPTPKRNRGRPPGTGRKQQLANLGEWMNSSAGQAFAPHVITIEAGEDIVAKLLLFSQQRPRALCILSGNGTVSSVALRHPASTGVSVTYEGRFQILCLSGSYLVAEDGGPRDRTGGISISLSSSDGHVIGGAAAMLIAATPVQVVLCSFVYGSSNKIKNKPVAGPNSSESSDPQHSEKLPSPSTTPPTQNYAPSTAGIWPGGRLVDARNAHTGIDLTRG